MRSDVGDGATTIHSNDIAVTQDRMHQFGGGLGHRLDPVSGVVAVGGDRISVCGEYWRCRAVDNSTLIDARSYISTVPDSKATGTGYVVVSRRLFICSSHKPEGAQR